MHGLANLIKDLAVILCVASLVTLLFQKIRQPVVLGYLVAGVIVGPYTPPHALVNDIPNIQILSELGIIFLMFALGLEFSFHKLKRVGFSSGVTGLLEVIFMLLLGFSTGKLIGWSFYDSLFLGAALAISSTTIIIKALEELTLKKRRFAEIVFGILIVEDLLAILLLVGLTTIVATQNIFSSAIAWATLKLILVVGGWFLSGYFLLPPLFRRIMKYASEETLTIASIALCLLLVCIADYFHYSTALGAFIMGSILAETSLARRIRQLILPIRNIFAAVFFVSVGMLINPLTIWQQLPIVFVICAVTIIGKLLITGTAALLTGQNAKNSLRIGFSMAQIGEFSFIIIGLGAVLKVTSNTLYPIIVAVSAITTFTTPYLIQFSGYLSNKVEQNLSGRAKYLLESYAIWIYRLTSGSHKQPLYRKASARLIINGIVIGIIFTIIKSWGLAKIVELFETLWLSKIAGWFAAILLSSPFIWGMLTAFRIPNIAQKESSDNLLLYLTGFIVVMEISILSISYFNTWSIMLLLILIASLFFSVVYRHLDKSYQWFENQLVKNLNNGSLQKKRYEELAPWDTNFVEVDVNRHSPLIDRTLAEHQLRQLFGINIVAIFRGTEVILSPHSNEIIKPFDKLILLGSDEKIEAFSKNFIKHATEAEDADILKNFSIKALSLEAGNPLIGKSIREANIREQTQGLVVGIERQGNHLLNPDSNTLLEKDDLLFIVGEDQYLKKFKLAHTKD
jgi:CPA2 family monovalent cation:H+ antiporter-2